jgi:hypothetical protein
MLPNPAAPPPKAGTFAEPNPNEDPPFVLWGEPILPPNIFGSENFNFLRLE